MKGSEGPGAGSSMGRYENWAWWAPRKVGWPVLATVPLFLWQTWMGFRPGVERLAVSFPLAVVAYVLLALTLGFTRREVTRHGYRLRPGGLWVGRGKREGRTEDVVELFQMLRLEAIRKSAPERVYYAAAELKQGGMVLLAGPFDGPAAADEALKRIAEQWPEVRRGAPRRHPDLPEMGLNTDWLGTFVLLLLAIAVGGGWSALTWGARVID